MTTTERKPKAVSNHYDYWNNEPPELSERCQYWVRQIKSGWTPNKRIKHMGYDSGAEWYGVYIWEYFNVIKPLLRG